jgi:deoxyuridine 5'-triphosphate nucleotidohydrolase
MAGIIPECKVMVGANGILPSKLRPTDDGYDLWLVEDKGPVQPLNDENVRMYSTDIIVVPPLGWHVEILARSSLPMYGYQMSSAVGLIDANYRGIIKIILNKISTAAGPLALPFRACQMVLRRNVHYNVSLLSTNLEATSRGNAGFGSSG